MIGYPERNICILAAEVLLGMRGGFEVVYEAGAPWITFDERRCSITLTYHAADDDDEPVVQSVYVREADWADLIASVAASRGRDARGEDQ